MSDCIFCKIASGEMKSKIVYSDDDVVAFEDISPQAPNHFVVIPREHVEAVADIPADKRDRVVSGVFGAVSRLATEKGLSDKGYRVVLNQGSDAGQVVPHLHFHLLSGRGFSWPPG